MADIFQTEDVVLTVVDVELDESSSSAPEHTPTSSPEETATQEAEEHPPDIHDEPQEALKTDSQSVAGAKEAEGVVKEHDESRHETDDDHRDDRAQLRSSTSPCPQKRTREDEPSSSDKRARRICDPLQLRTTLDDADETASENEMIIYTPASTASAAEQSPAMLSSPTHANPSASPPASVSMTPSLDIDEDSITYNPSTEDWKPAVYMAGNTTIDSKRTIMKSFQDLGGKVTKSIVEADVYCVPDEPLARTGSLLIAVCQGKHIVTQRWLAAIHREGLIPDPRRYLPRDRKHEKEWGFNLKEAIARGQQGMTHVLRGRTVYFTSRLMESFNPKLRSEFMKLATALGADNVKKSAPSKAAMSGDKVQDKVIILAHDDADKDVDRVTEMGLPVYTKELLVMGALRGRLDFGQFTRSSPVKEEPS